MKLFGYEFVVAQNKKWYWWPKRLTLYINPPIYRWGIWNFCKINVGLETW